MAQNDLADGVRAPVSDAKILVVDDEPHLVGMYASMLEGGHTVKTATSGQAALRKLDGSFDIMLLDRRMPDLSGDEVLKTIRAQGLDCRIALVTSVEPDYEIIDLQFDAYVVKPVRRTDLHELVENLILRSRFSDGVKETLSTTSKLVALESQYDEEELSSNSEYQALLEEKRRLDELNRERMEELVERGDTGMVFQDVFREV